MVAGSSPARPTSEAMFEVSVIKLNVYSTNMRRGDRLLSCGDELPSPGVVRLLGASPALGRAPSAGLCVVIAFTHCPVEEIGDLGVDACPTHVPVLGHRYMAVSEMVGADAR